MGLPTQISEIPPDFCPVFVQHDDEIHCYCHDGVPVELGVELTLDPVENARRVERLRHSVWWHVEMIRRGVNPDREGRA